MDHAGRDGIIRFVLANPENQHREDFDEPLVGIASAADPLFAEYRKIIGPLHRTPPERFRLKQMRWLCTGERSSAESSSSPGLTRESNRRERVWPQE